MTLSLETVWSVLVFSLYTVANKYLETMKKYLETLHVIALDDKFQSKCNLSEERCMNTLLTERSLYV